MQRGGVQPGKGLNSSDYFVFIKHRIVGKLG